MTIAAPRRPQALEETRRPTLAVSLGGTAAVSGVLALVLTAIPWTFFLQPQPLGRAFGYLFAIPVASMAVAFGGTGLLQAVRAAVAGRATSRTVAGVGAVLCAAAVADGMALFGRMLPG